MVKLVLIKKNCNFIMTTPYDTGLEIIVMFIGVLQFLITPRRWVWKYYYTQLPSFVEDFGVVVTFILWVVCKGIVVLFVIGVVLNEKPFLVKLFLVDLSCQMIFPVRCEAVVSTSSESLYEITLIALKYAD